MDLDNNVLDETQIDVVDQSNEADTPEITEEVVETTDTIGGEDAEGESTGDVATPRKQSAEDNAKYAAARRKAEAEKAQAEKDKAELETQLRALERAVKGFGYTGSIQEIADQLEAQQREMTPEQVKNERELREAEIQKAIENHPAIKQAKLTQIETALARDIAEIQKLNPTIHSLEDLEGDAELEELVRHGINLAKAYKLVHPTPKQVKPDTKSHLTGINAGDAASDGLVEIPSNELAFYKEQFPEKKPAELRDIYNRILKRQKGE